MGERRTAQLDASLSVGSSLGRPIQVEHQKMRMRTVQRLLRSARLRAVANLLRLSLSLASCAK